MEASKDNESDADGKNSESQITPKVSGDKVAVLRSTFREACLMSPDGGPFVQKESISEKSLFLQQRSTTS